MIFFEFFCFLLFCFLFLLYSERLVRGTRLLYLRLLVELRVDIAYRNTDIFILVNGFNFSIGDGN